MTDLDIYHHVHITSLDCEGGRGLSLCRCGVAVAIANTSNVIRVSERLKIIFVDLLLLVFFDTVSLQVVRIHHEMM